MSLELPPRTARIAAGSSSALTVRTEGRRPFLHSSLGSVDLALSIDQRRSLAGGVEDRPQSLNTSVELTVDLAKFAFGARLHVDCADRVGWTREARDRA